MDTKKLLTAQVSDQELPESAIAAIQKVNLINKVIAAWSREIENWSEELGYDGRNKLQINLFEVNFPEKTTGRIYADIDLNARPKNAILVKGSDVDIIGLRCYMSLGMADNPGVIKSIPVYKIRLEFKLRPTPDIFTFNVFDFDIAKAHYNWVLDKDQNKRGFSMYSNYSYYLGLALIFDNDVVRQDIILNLEKTTQKIIDKFVDDFPIGNPKLNFIHSFDLKYYTEEQIETLSETRRSRK